MSVAYNPTRRQSSFSSGYERTRHSDICGSIATYEGSGGEDSDQESFFLDSPNGALVSQDPLSWDQVFTHIGEPCQKSLKAPHKWAMDETAPSDIKLGNTTLFNKWFAKHVGLALDAANQLQPIWSQPRVKAVTFADSLARAKNRIKGIAAELNLKVPASLTA